MQVKATPSVLPNAAATTDSYDVTRNLAGATDNTRLDSRLATLTTQRGATRNTYMTCKIME